MKIYRIIKGFFKALKKDDQKLHDHRFEICKACPLIDLKGLACVVPGTHPCCGDCGCSLNMKLRVKEEACPKGKW